MACLSVPGGSSYCRHSHLSGNVIATDTENLPTASLRPYTANPEFALPEASMEPFTERYPWLLPTLVAIAALLIGVFLNSMVRQSKEMLPPPPEPT